MRYTFQETRIWEGGNDRPDPTCAPVTIKVKPGAEGEARARRKLPRSLGRKWVLVSSDEKDS
jgi:hypothetical protein